jgi:hypothetical protein
VQGFAGGHVNIARRAYELTPATALELDASWTDTIRWTEFPHDLSIDPGPWAELARQLAELAWDALVKMWLGLEAQVRLLYERPTEQLWVVAGWRVARAEMFLASGLRAVDTALDLIRANGGAPLTPPALPPSRNPLGGSFEHASAGVYNGIF